MNVIRIPILTLFFVFLVSGSTVALGQMPSFSMFNGMDLQQWVKADGSPVDQGWIVEEGCIFRKKAGGDIFFRELVGDFEFHFEWKISENGNSGVKYRVQKYGNAWLGCEYQILFDDEKTPADQRAGGLYALFAPTENKPIIESDIWYRGKIRVCNNHVQHWINNQLVVDAQIRSSLWFERVKASKFRDQEKFGENQIGRIMLQDHGNQVWFRNLSLIHLNSQMVQPYQNWNSMSPLNQVQSCDFDQTNPMGVSFERIGNGIAWPSNACCPDFFHTHFDQYSHPSCFPDAACCPKYPGQFYRHPGMFRRLRICN